MARLIWTAAALGDLERLHRSMAAGNPAGADQAVRAIRQAFEPLALRPEVGPPAEELPPEFREWPIEVEPCRRLAIYRYDGGDEVVILALRAADEVGR